MNRNRNSNSFFRQRNDRSTSETLKAPSLYEHYLRYGSPRRGFDIMNSYRKTQGSGKDYRITHNPETRKQGKGKLQQEGQRRKTVIFKCPVEGTDVKIERTIDVVDDINGQDILSWATEFKEIVSLCGWEEKAAFTILKSLIDQELFHLIKDKRTVVTGLNALIKAKYPEKKTTYYVKKYQSIYQENYTFIEEYAAAIKNAVIELGACRNWKVSELSERIEEAFHTGLSQRTSLEILKYEDQTMANIIDKIMNAEQILLNTSSTQEIREEPETRKHSNHSFRGKQYPRQTRSDDYSRAFQPSSYRKPYHKRPLSKPWHQTKREENREKKTQNQNYAVLAPKKNNSPIELIAVCEKQKINCILDSGSKLNYISEDVAKKCELEEHEVAEKKVELANQGQVLVNKRCTLYLEFL